MRVASKDNLGRLAPRLYLPQRLEVGAECTLNRAQSHYLLHVLRLKLGDYVRLFNESDGEWFSQLVSLDKKQANLQCESQLAPALPPPDIEYIFAPLKQARLDHMVQKATELGVRRLRPVQTARTIITRLNHDRLAANIIEAAEQCNLVYRPELDEMISLDKLIDGWSSERALIFCDETAARMDSFAALAALKCPVALLVGPEGGFTEEERARIYALANVTILSLGPRILRADTASIAALSLLQAVLGDWLLKTA